MSTTLEIFFAREPDYAPVRKLAQKLFCAREQDYFGD
jgi:hypothetical protein